MASFVWESDSWAEVRVTFFHICSALKACTLNPAKVLHIDHETGSIEVGKYADLVALDDEYRVRKVFVKGKLVYES